MKIFSIFNMRILAAFWAVFALSIMMGSPRVVYSQDTEATTHQDNDINPHISAADRAKIAKFYQNASNSEATRRALAEIRRQQISDPLDQATHEMLRASPEFAKFITETNIQVAGFIRSSRIGHMGAASLAMPGKDGQLQELLKEMEDLRGTGIYLFPAEARMNIFAKAGAVNAYTYSGSIYDLDVVWFDGLLDLTESTTASGDLGKGMRYQIGGHELGHIFFGHIPQRVALDLIFHATAKILVPPEAPKRADGDKNDKNKDKPLTDEEGKKAADFNSSVRAERLADWKEKFARELVPHVGKMVDEDPSYISNIVDIMDAQADRLIASLGADAVLSLASKYVAAYQGLDSNAKPPVITKDMEKAFDAAMTRLSNSDEASADRIGKILTALLDPKNHRDASAMAYIKLMGSKRGTLAAMRKQVSQYLDKIGSEEGRAFRQVGDGHPNIVSRVAFMDSYPVNNRDTFRILTNPFLMLVWDYIQLTTKMSQLSMQVRSPLAREIMDRETDDAQLKTMQRSAAEMSHLIANIVADEVKAWHQGKTKDVDSTLVVLDALQRVINIGAQPNALASVRDIRNELGRPGRLGTILIEKLQGVQKELGIKDPSALPGTTPAAMVAVSTTNQASGTTTTSAAAVAGSPSSLSPFPSNPFTDTPMVVEFVHRLQAMIPAALSPDLQSIRARAAKGPGTVHCATTLADAIAGGTDPLASASNPEKPKSDGDPTPPITQ